MRVLKLMITAERLMYCGLRSRPVTTTNNSRLFCLSSKYLSFNAGTCRSRPVTTNSSKVFGQSNRYLSFNAGTSQTYSASTKAVIQRDNRLLYGVSGFMLIFTVIGLYDELIRQPQEKEELQRVQKRFLDNEIMVLQEVCRHFSNLSMKELQSMDFPPPDESPLTPYLDRAYNPYLQRETKRYGTRETASLQLRKWQIFQRLLFDPENTSDANSKRLALIESCSHFFEPNIFGNDRKEYFQTQLSKNQQEKYFYAAIYYYMQSAKETKSTK